MQKIDFVIPWVDGKDEEWQKEKAKYNSKKIDTSNSENRYRDWENLQYWFRGVEKFANWVNRIHFITCGHLPKWLNTNNPKLNIVKHSDYIPKQYLPTFSANPIELNLHRIEGLAEQFVYFNDDLFLCKEVKENEFFQNGLPRDLALADIFYPTEDKLWQSMLLNNVYVINKNFNKKEVIKDNWSKWINLKYGKYVIKNIALLNWNKFSSIQDRHLTSNMLKSTYEKVWEKEYELLDKVSQNKFRTEEDVTQYIFKWWQMCEGNFLPRKPYDGKVFSISKDLEEIVKSIENQKYKIIALNDTEVDVDFEKSKEAINKAFNKILPEKSSFEL